MHPRQEASAVMDTPCTNTIVHILSLSFEEVDVTALLTEQIGQNGPKTTNYFSPR